MKKLYIIYLALSLSLISGCKKSGEFVESSDNDGSVIIEMNIYNDSSATRASSAYALQDGILGSGEYVISTLRFYVFDSNGSLEEMELYTGLNADQIVKQTITVAKDSSKELYFVANEPDAITSKLNDITTIEELEQVNFTIAESMNKGFNGAATFDDFSMPMSAKYSVLNAMADLNIYVGLTRAVARVDLWLIKDDDAVSRSVVLGTSTTLSASGVTDEPTLFSGDIADPTGVKNISINSSDITLSATAFQRVFSFYTAERTYDYTDEETRIKITVDGLVEEGNTLDSKSITLGDDGSLMEINRNYVYRIYGTYNGSEIVASFFEVMEWEDEYIDAEIEGVMVAVDSEVAMDWLLSGNTYSAPSISFGSNKTISFYLPVLVGSSDDLNYEFKLFEFEEMSAGRSYDLKKIALTNNYIFATSWIESAIIHFTSDRSGYIDFVYSPVKVNYKIQNYPIRIKSDNVTKQMVATYDNGYLPATLLSDDWAKRAPGGVVFAKRGEANHPLTTPDILHRDDDGYYRGEYQTTADVTATYCEDTFGDGWYMPSYSDMQDIASMFDMLGVSYRFQNNGSEYGSGLPTESRYWTSSASSEYSGYYWTADFMSRDYMIEGLFERRDGTQSHFVRCVMDLQ